MTRLPSRVALAVRPSRETAKQLRTLYGILLLLNIAMLSWDTAKFLGNEQKFAPKVPLSPRGDGEGRRPEKLKEPFSPVSGADARGKWA